MFGLKRGGQKVPYIMELHNSIYSLLKVLLRLRTQHTALDSEISLSPHQFYKRGCHFGKSDGFLVSRLKLESAEEFWTAALSKDACVYIYISERIFWTAEIVRVLTEFHTVQGHRNSRSRSPRHKQSRSVSTLRTTKSCCTSSTRQKFLMLATRLWPRT
jgi:hypothetical protein